MQIEIVRSNRKTLALQINRDGIVTARAPNNMSDAVIMRFINEKQGWIEKHLKRRAERKSAYPEPTAEETKALTLKAKDYLPKAVEQYGCLMGLKPTSVKITSAKTRFGSCNAKNGLCFSYRLMMYPKEAIDYVVVHELAHIRHHDHSQRFWDLVETYMPDYKIRRKMLK